MGKDEFGTLRSKWIVIRDGVFECLRCGTKYQVKLPISVPLLCTVGKLFIQGHRSCKEVGHG